MEYWREENLNRMAALVADIESDVVVFPELCTSGYFFTSRNELDQVAETANGACLIADPSIILL